MNINWLEVIPSLTSSGAIIISAIALIISIRNRRNALRESIYNRELDTIQEIMNLLSQLPDVISEWITKSHFNSDNENKEIREVRLKYHSLALKIVQSKIKRSLFFPKNLHSDFDDLTSEIFKLHNDFIKVEYKDSSIVLNAYKTFEKKVRKEMKLEELSNENFELIKSKIKQKIKDIH